ncbi:hypothetical protein BACCELL_00306 [Bacteroides cellulosilyticus DSM 14838]|uniref:Uncharacterized protein n=1 Tax=Bacteroides cellulosilyticus DSM 14838 TaxID=537012 RepID=E2N7R3_9BACE|nr:hypothetical protein BACCELL_00306 [Bacteroides cellulosilyticus DSM 14838]
MGCKVTTNYFVTSKLALTFLSYSLYNINKKNADKLVVDILFLLC